MNSTHWYEPNICSNPRKVFGVWTPEGWKAHVIRKVRAKPRLSLFSGDGYTTTFSGLPESFLVDAHDPDVLATDGGIYPCEPRVEYPPGRPRWAISHTFLAYPYADQSLYGEEATFDVEKNVLKTHFRKRVFRECAVTDSKDGMTVRVANAPISTVVVGNKHYKICNSAVRGVWADEAGKTENLYTREAIMRVESLNGVYLEVERTPVVNCSGVWAWLESDRELFDAKGNCIDREGLIASGIPLHAPALSGLDYEMPFIERRTEFYGGTIQDFVSQRVTLSEKMLIRLRGSKGFPFEEHRVGYAGVGRWDHERDVWGVPGFYCPSHDFDSDGVISDADEFVLRKSLGNTYRVNYYTAGYFGFNWLSTGMLFDVEMCSVPVIAFWTYGAGYNAEAGIVRLFKTPGPSKRVWIEYHHDVPAETGRENIAVYTWHAV